MPFNSIANLHAVSDIGKLTAVIHSNLKQNIHFDQNLHNF